MQVSLTFALFLVLGVLGQVEWVAVRIKTASTAAISSGISSSSNFADLPISTSTTASSRSITTSSFTGLPASTSAISSSPPRTTGTSLALDSCLTYFATTITPATSYFTEYTVYEEPFIFTSTDEAAVPTTTTEVCSPPAQTIWTALKLMWLPPGHHHQHNHSPARVYHGS